MKTVKYSHQQPRYYQLSARHFVHNHDYQHNLKMSGIQDAYRTTRGQGVQSCPTISVSRTTFDVITGCFCIIHAAQALKPFPEYCASGGARGKPAALATFTFLTVAADTRRIFLQMFEEMDREGDDIQGDLFADNRSVLLFYCVSNNTSFFSL